VVRQLPVNVAYFGFDELNSMALFNAQIHLSKQAEPNCQWIAYVPPGFKKLAFAADCVYEYPVNLCPPSYQVVSEFVPQGLREKISQFRQQVFLRVFRFLGLSGFWLMVLHPLIASSRSNKFFVKSGLLWFCVKQAFRNRSTNSATIVSDWVSVVGSTNGSARVFTCRLSESFQIRFAWHYEAISRGLRLSLKGLESKYQYIIRTRNFLRKAPEHNSKLALVKQVVQQLTEDGSHVANIGSPPLKLNLDFPGYFEFDSLTLDQELALIGESAAIFTEGGAGLFTLMATMDNRLTILSPEWSLEALREPISLMAARGVRDGD
jgi:hypothetical protein